MWITPPDHKKFVLVQNHIAQDYNKYGIKWLDDNNWVNQQGVTWQQVDQLCGEVMSRVPGKLKISFPEYADLRQMGFSHWDIVNLRTSPDFDQRLQQGVARVKDQIQDRLAKILTLKDSD